MLRSCAHWPLLPPCVFGIPHPHRPGPISLLFKCTSAFLASVTLSSCGVCNLSQSLQRCTVFWHFFWICLPFSPHPDCTLLEHRGEVLHFFFPIFLLLILLVSYDPTFYPFLLLPFLLYMFLEAIFKHIWDKNITSPLPFSQHLSLYWLSTQRFVRSHSINTKLVLK